MDVAKILIKMIKGTDDYDQWIEYIEDRPFNDLRYYISNEKVKQLGWTIKVGFFRWIARIGLRANKNLFIAEKSVGMNIFIINK